MASLQGRPVDRPAVSFYEIGGFAVDPSNPDPFNIYNDPSWHPLLELAEEKTDLIRMRGARAKPRHPEIRNRFFTWSTQTGAAAKRHELQLRIAKRNLQQVQQRDLAVDTWWMVEHLLKDEADIEAYLELPDEALEMDYDCSPIHEADREVGDRGIVMIDTADPLCVAAGMMSMADYTVVAMTNPPLFHRLLQKAARQVHSATEKIARECPGFLWRIYGPEYASEPYLPPRLFEEYVLEYVRPMVDMIHSSGGYVRLHCHGRLRNILDLIVKTGADAMDPIEPPPQGDVELRYVRQRYGEQLTLFGNIEASEIELLEEGAFERRVAQAIEEGTCGPGRGFVLLPSACPYGRTITARTMANYQTMVRLAMGQC